MSNPQVIHSKLSFSSRSRWRNCGLSVKLSKGMPDSSSPAAAEGTAAHIVAEFYVRQDFQIVGHMPAPAEAPLQTPPEGLDLKGQTVTEWNEELRKHGRAYSAFIRSLIPAGCSGHVVLEEKVAARKIHDQLFGTADALLWIMEIKRLVVIDYKFGFMDVAIGTADDTNPQLAAYAVAAVEQWNLPFDSIGLAVFQPRRNFGAPSQYLELDAPWHDAERAKLTKEVAAVETATAPVPGDWCRYCKGKSKCPAIINALETGIQAHGGLVDVLSIPDGALIDLWAATTGITALLKDIDERIGGLVKAGHARLTVKEGSSRRMWADERAAVAALIAMNRLETLKPGNVSEVAPLLPEAWQKALITHSQPSRSIKLVTPVEPGQVAATFAKYVKGVDKA